MKRTSVLVVLVAVTTMLLAGVRAASTGADPDGLVAHEWGTFTTVAGPDGRAVDWLPLGGPTDLPCFVERYKNGGLIKGLPGNLPALTYDAARAHLPGKVRMETPVIYFYSPREVTANVRVVFPRGVITEWYPRAIVQQPDVTTQALHQEHRKSVIEWRAVRVKPAAEEAFPKEPGDSHYYAARDTDAAPLAMDGQREKFLFYRGVAGFDVPISATALPHGAVRVTNLGSRDLRGVILFENRDGRMSYRIHGTLRGEATLAPSSTVGDPAFLRTELERILTEAGLYPREAQAMVATWRDSWFEEGTRVFYVLAPREVDTILPLTIDPDPVQTARVFVGRMDVITPQVLESVRRAIVARDDATLGRHGRFLGAIAARLVGQGAAGLEAGRITEVTSAAFATYAGRLATCR